MRILVHEYVTGGGWHTKYQNPPPPRSLLCEAEFMLRQTCRSLSSVEDVEITLFRDARLHLREPKSFGHSAPTRVVPIHNDGQLYLYLRSEPGKHDATILIAPDDALYMVWNHVRHCGGNIFISGREFLLVACSKHATSRWLQAYGVRAPRGIVLKRNTPLAVNFRYPAIIKPVYGCGSQGVRKVEGPDDAGLDDAWRAECAYQDLRLEQFIPGQPASVGAIVGMIETVFLPPCFQRIDSQNNFDYCGGGAPVNKLYENGRLDSAETLYCRSMIKRPFDVALVQAERHVHT